MLKWGSSRKVNHHGLPHCYWLLRNTGEAKIVIDYRESIQWQRICIILWYQWKMWLIVWVKTTKIFFFIDLKSGYWQVPLDPETAHKSAFSTHQGHFEFTRMPFGFCNAPFASQTHAHRSPKNDLQILFSLHWRCNCILKRHGRTHSTLDGNFRTFQTGEIEIAPFQMWIWLLRKFFI